MVSKSGISWLPGFPYFQGIYVCFREGRSTLPSHHHGSAGFLAPKRRRGKSFSRLPFSTEPWWEGRSTLIKFQVLLVGIHSSGHWESWCKFVEGVPGTLKLTKSQLKMDGWKTIVSFWGIFASIFRCELAVSGTVIKWYPFWLSWVELPILIPKKPFELIWESKSNQLSWVTPVN